MVENDRATGLGRDLSAAPRWAYAQEATRNTTGPGHRTNVPQVASAGDLLFTLGERSADEGEGLLLCQLSIDRDRNWDARGLFGANAAPDPTVWVQLGDAPNLTIRIPEDTHEAAFSIPNVSLSAGTAMRWTVVDRDLARDDRVGSVTADWPTESPLRLEVGAARLRCGLASRAWLQERVEAAAAAASRSIALLRDVRPHLNSTSPLGDAPQLSTVRRDLHALAALVGWGDAEVIAIRSRHDEWEARYWADHAEQARALAASASRGEPAALGRHQSVRLDTFRCDANSVAHPCEVELTVRRTRAGGSSSAPTVSIVTPGAPSALCLPPDTNGAGSWTLPGAVGAELGLSTRCSQPSGGGEPSSWIVYLRSRASEAALMLPE